MSGKPIDFNTFRREFDRITKVVPKHYRDWCRFSFALADQERREGYIGTLTLWLPKHDGNWLLCRRKVESLNEALAVLNTFYHGLPGLLGATFYPRKAVPNG